MLIEINTLNDDVKRREILVWNVRVRVRSKTNTYSTVVYENVYIVHLLIVHTAGSIKLFLKGQNVHFYN